MPVEDMNAVSMGETFTNLFGSTESVSSFWSQNPGLPAFGIILMILFGLMVFLLFFLKGSITKIFR